MYSRAITEKGQQIWDTSILVKEKCVLLHEVARITLCGSKDFPDHFSSCHKYYKDSTTWETRFIEVTALTVTWHVAAPCRTGTTWAMLAAAHHQQLMLQTPKHPNSALSNSDGSKLLLTEGKLTGPLHACRGQCIFAKRWQMPRTLKRKCRGILRSWAGAHRVTHLPEHRSGDV